MNCYSAMTRLSRVLLFVLTTVSIFSTSSTPVWARAQSCESAFAGRPPTPDSVWPPRFLMHEQVVAIHNMQILEHGGLPGIKDVGLLSSALAQPEAGFGDHYFHADVYEMASAYLFHVAKNHAFHDGNKRVAALSSAVFLEVNWLRLQATPQQFQALVLEVASGTADKTHVADFFRSHAVAVADH